MTELAEHNWKNLFDELSGAVARLVPYDGWALVPDDIVAAADKLRELGAATGHKWLDDLAATMAPPPDCVKALEKFASAYAAIGPIEALGEGAAPSKEALAELRAATEAVLKAEPRCPAELGRKVRIACTIAIYTRVKNCRPHSAASAAKLYEQLWAPLASVEPWHLAKAAGYNYSPAEWEFGRRGGNFIVGPGPIEELLDSVPAAWKAEIAANVVRLNAQTHGAGK